MNNKIIFLATLVIGAFWIWLIYSILLSSMSYNSLSPKLLTEKKVIFKSIFPEGFSFFTRDPREPQAIIYDADSKRELSTSPIESFFGFSRYERALTIELGIILNVVRDQKWLDCYNTEENGCFEEENVPVYYLKNSVSNPLLCGEYYVKIVEPVPWAWSGTFKKNQREMPYKIVKLGIKCNETTKY